MRDGVDRSTAEHLQQAIAAAPADHFTTPDLAGGLLLATSSDRVVATAKGCVFPASGVIALVALVLIVGVALLTRRRPGRD